MNKEYKIISEKIIKLIKSELKDEKDIFINYIFVIETVLTEKIIHSEITLKNYTTIKNYSEGLFYLFEKINNDKVNFIKTETQKKIKKMFSNFEIDNDDYFISWMYQFYNDDERKILKENKNKKVSHKKLILQSQIYTPEWVTDYLVRKSIEKTDEKSFIKIFDPACGSGNFLIKAYDCLKEYYKDNDYEKIIKGIYGIDIDERAVLVTKIIFYYKLMKDGYIKYTDINTFCTSDSDNEEEKITGSLYPESSFIKNMKFDIVVTNPPYTDSSEYDETLKKYIKKHYGKFYKNLYSCFIKRSTDLLTDGGISAMITPQTFMYISSFKNTREYIVENTNIVEFIHIGLNSIFSDVLVDTCMFILKKGFYEEKSIFYDFSGKNKNIKILTQNIENQKKYTVEQKMFAKLPGYQFAYWINEESIKIFNNDILNAYFEARQGIATGNNEKYLRYIWEIPENDISLCRGEDSKKWIPYTKGGPYNKWYGNLFWLISYDEESKKQLKKIGNHLPSEKYYFRNGITYTMTTSKGPTFRYLPENHMFDCKGSAIFTKKISENKEFILLGILNSEFIKHIYDFISGSVDMEVGDIKNLPLPEEFFAEKYQNKILQNLVKLNVGIKKQNLKINFKDNYFEYYKDFPDEKAVYDFYRRKHFLDIILLLSEVFIEEIIFQMYGQKTESLEKSGYKILTSKDLYLLENIKIKDLKYYFYDDIKKFIGLTDYEIDETENYINSEIKINTEKIKISNKKKSRKEYYFNYSEETMRTYCVNPLMNINLNINKIYRENILYSITELYIMKYTKKNKVIVITEENDTDKCFEDLYITNLKEIKEYFFKSFIKEYNKNYFQIPPLLFLGNIKNKEIIIFRYTEMKENITLIEKEIEKKSEKFSDILKIIRKNINNIKNTDYSLGEEKNTDFIKKFIIK